MFTLIGDDENPEGKSIFSRVDYHKKSAQEYIRQRSSQSAKQCVRAYIVLILKCIFNSLSFWQRLSRAPVSYKRQYFNIAIKKIFVFIFAYRFLCLPFLADLNIDLFSSPLHLTGSIITFDSEIRGLLCIHTHVHKRIITNHQQHIIRAETLSITIIQLLLVA